MKHGTTPTLAVKLGLTPEEVQTVSFAFRSSACESIPNVVEKKWPEDEGVAYDEETARWLITLTAEETWRFEAGFPAYMDVRPVLLNGCVPETAIVKLSPTVLSFFASSRKDTELVPGEPGATVEVSMGEIYYSGTSGGADGGYYAPAVDDDGNLTWTASKSGMPAVSSANIKGPKGDTGATGPQGPQGEVGADGQPGTDGKSAYQYAVEGGYTGTEAEFAAKLAQEQLTGTTNDLTPTQVYEAVSAGIPVKVQYIDSTYGLFSFTSFNVAESLNVIVSQTIVYYNGVYILAELSGGKSDNTWGFSTTTLAQKADIPAALPNPKALTFAGAVTGSYDGSTAKTVNIPSAVTDDHINSLIDTKLGVIENGAY